MFFRRLPACDGATEKTQLGLMPLGYRRGWLFGTRRLL